MLQYLPYEQIKQCCEICELGSQFTNPKTEYRNPKWFGQLTILSQVEGQIQNPNTQNSKLLNAVYPVSCIMYPAPCILHRVISYHKQEILQLKNLIVTE